MIELVNTTKRFSDFTALDGANLKIENGCAFGLLGSNGAGKSTILRLLSGVYSPDGGEVKIDGENVFDNPAAKAKVFFVSDETTQIANFTVDGMRDFYRGFYPNFSDEVFEKLLKKVNLPRKKRLADFSKGMKRQAIVITGLAAGTDYLLLDEAFDGLDPAMRIIVKNMLIDGMIDRNLTVILSSHNLREMGELCDTAAILHEGKIIFSKRLDEDSEFVKVQIAFSEGNYTEEDFSELEIKKYEKSGSVIRMIVRNDENTEAALRRKNPAVLDIVPMSLEEIFICEMEGIGYDFSEING